MDEAVTDAVTLVDADPSATMSVLDWKKKALQLKQAGDIPGAKAALLQAKQLEQKEMAQQEEHAQQNEEQTGAPSPQDATPAEEENANPDDANVDEMEESVNDDEGLLNELQTDNDNNMEDEDFVFDPSAITFSLEEMQDESMMLEFKIGGMPVPGDDEYKAKIQQLKQAALQHKQADNKEKALSCLRACKQLEVVRKALEHQVPGELGLRINEDDDDWLETMNSNDTAEFVAEAYGFGNAQKKSTVLSIDDIVGDDIDMDAATLLDMTEMGIAKIPTVQDVLQRAAEKKADALTYKTAGDLENAKKCLRESKELQAKAGKLDVLLKEIEKMKHGKDIPDEPDVEVSNEALEALLNGEESTKNNEPPPQPKSPQQKPKTAAELKEEAIKYRDAGNIAEAAKVLKLYKVALQKEAEAEDLRKRDEMIADIENEIAFIKKQKRLFLFYKRFVDNSTGAEIWNKWNEYESRCLDVIKVLRLKGGKAVSISRKASNHLLQLVDEVATFVQRGSDPSDDRLEFAVLDITELDQNKTLQKILKGKQQSSGEPGKLRANVTIQLPPSESESDQSIHFALDSARQEENVYYFEGSHYIQPPVRGDCKFATRIRQRMERRKIHVNLEYVPPHVAKQQQQKSSWLWGSSSVAKTDENTKEEDTILLGKIVLELKDLLTSNCIAGNFPLLAGGSTRPAGGSIGLVLRTGVPFDPEQLITDTEPSIKCLTPHDAFIFSIAAQDAA